MTEYLFVYGTLKRGQRNHQLLRGWTYSHDVFTDEGYVLYQPDGFLFPYMYKSEGGCVYGELYHTDLSDPFTILDYLEGVDSNHYKRERVLVYEFGEYKETFAFTYLATDETVRSWDREQTSSFKLFNKEEDAYVW